MRQPAPGQLSLFGVSARAPSVADLDGLLAGNGHAVRRQDAARISVVVEEPWRVEVLVAELSGRLGLAAEVARTETGITVRTPWLAELRQVADAWTRGAIKLPPPGWVLDGPRLRWWCLAAGRSPAPGNATGAGVYTLALGPSDEQAWLGVGAALAGAGVPGVLIGPRADGPAYRIVGRRRLARLLELVGEPPTGIAAGGWPTLA
jgi:hypothetical protein